MNQTLSAETVLVGIGSVDQETLNHLRQVIESAFGCRCSTGASLPMPEDAYVLQRGQYSANAILQRLSRRREGRVLGVVDVDLFVPELNFVFELADPSSGRAVIALPRLHQAFYGARQNQALFPGRAAKEAIHELGHIYGLEHCRDHECVMTFSNSVQDTDRKGQGFCTKCARKLQR